MCDLDSGICVNQDEARLRKAAIAAATTPSSVADRCGAVERAECYDKCSPKSRKEILCPSLPGL